MTRSLRVWLPALRAGSGADVFMKRLAQGLERAGHEPLLQWFPHRCEWQPWTLASVTAPANLDIIHTGSWQGFAFRRGGVPLVVTEHQYIRHPAFMPHRGRLQSLYHDAFVRHCVSRSYRVADALVAVSEHTAQAMRAAIDRPVHMIHNWVDTTRFLPVARQSREGGTPFRLLFVGNPSRWKGADVLPALAERLGPAFDIQCMGGLRRQFDAARMPPGIRLRDASGKILIARRADTQAQAAEKYQEYKAEERQLKAQLSALRWQALNEQVGQRVVAWIVAVGYAAGPRTIGLQRDGFKRLVFPEAPFRRVFS